MSWGTLMREAQSLQTLGSNPWLMWPVAFILLAVIGFNFLGTGCAMRSTPTRSSSPPRPRFGRKSAMCNA